MLTQIIKELKNGNAYQKVDAKLQIEIKVINVMFTQPKILIARTFLKDFC